jgi:multimeric flavodoxin WrbA
MKILVINGSPNKEKSTTLMLTQAFLRGMGETADVVNTVDLKLNPCRACYACWFATGGHCVQQDDALPVLEKIRAADLVIWSVPLYCYGAPAHCKALMDRTLCFNQPEMYLDEHGIAHHYGYEDGSKKTVLISTGGLPNCAGNFDGLVFQFRHMFGPSTAAICCAEGSLLMQKETAALIQPYLDAVWKAGGEYRADGTISPETQRVLDTPALPPEEYIRQTNAVFKNIKQCSRK